MKKELVSVIIPLYNETKYLNEALDSICNQTYDNLEILIIDSSTDPSVEKILKNYSEKIKVIKQEKCGVAVALNCGLENAQGAYIARMDADDISMSNRIEQQVEFLSNNLMIDVVGSRAIVIDAEGRTEWTSSVPCLHENIETNLIFENPMWHPTIMFRKKLVDEGWRYDTSKRTEDYDLWTRLIASGVKFANIYDVLLKYRQYGGNCSTVNLEINEFDAARSAKKYLEDKLKISFQQYDDDQFLRVGNKRLAKKRDCKYLVQQLDVLYTIYKRNEETNAFEKNSLNYELNKRWQEYIAPYYSGVTTALGMSDLYDMESISRNQIFINKLGFMLGISDDNKQELLDAFERYFELVRNNIKEWLQSDKTMVIYGCGQRSAKVLDVLSDLAGKRIINWKVIGVSDKTAKANNTIFKYIDPKNIVQEKYDYVIITSNKFFYEIKSQLIILGIPSSKILDNDWLFDIDGGTL